MRSNRINLTAENERARQTREFAEGLRNARRELLSYQSELQSHWNATEMTHINNAINDLLNRLKTEATSLDNISTDIVTAAQEVRRAEELADARAALASAEAAFNHARVGFASAQGVLNAAPDSAAAVAAVQAARITLSNAENVRNNADAQVRALS